MVNFSDVDGFEITNIKELNSFITGGKAEFTIFQKPNKQAKYKIIKSQNREGFYFVHAELSDKQNIDKESVSNGKNLVYQGYLYTSDNIKFRFSPGNKGVSNYNKQSVYALLWVLEHSKSNKFPDAVHIYHHGKCSRCGKKLTDADSLARGLGPTCFKYS